MAVNLSPVGGVAAQFFDNSGNPLSGGKLYSYLAGTTTPATTYTSSNGSTAHSNPIVLDAAGRVPAGGEIWLTDGINYKFVLKTSTDTLIATYDNITGINSNSVSFTNQQEIATATAGQTVFNLGITYQPGTHSLSVFVDGVNQYGPGAQYSYVETDENTVTFNSGLHVGASVKFTTTQQQGAGAVNASQVTYDPPFTGSVATNVEAKLAQSVNVKDFGAVGDGVTDDTVALQNWATCGVKDKYLAAGTYKVNAAITLEDGSMVRGDGAASVIDASGAASFSGSYVIGTVGSLTQIENLASNVNKGAITLTFASAPNAAADDVLIVYNPTDYSWSGFRPYYRAGEFFRIKSINSTVATVWGQAYDGYIAANVNVYKLVGKKVTIKDFVVRSPNASIPGVLLKLCVDSSVTNVNSNGGHYAGIQVMQSFNVRVSNGKGQNSYIPTGQQYGLTIDNCQDIYAEGEFYGTRHGVSTGGGDFVGCVPSRNIRVSNSTLFARSGNSYSADVHGNSEAVFYENCTIYNGAGIGGKDVTYRGCQIFGQEIDNGTCVSSGEIYGGNFRFIDCEFVSYGALAYPGVGLIDVGGTNNAVTSDTKEDCNFIIENCSVRAPNNTTNIVVINNRGSTYKINVSINEIMLDSPAAKFLKMECVSGASTSNGIKVDNVIGLAAGSYLAYLTGGYENAKLKMQRQTGTRSITLTSGTYFTLDSAVDFKWYYPKTPSAQATPSGATYAGNQSPNVVITTLTNGTIRLALTSANATNFSATTTYTVGWSVGIDEV